MDERDLAERLYDIVSDFETERPIRRLKINLRDQGRNNLDELQQFRQLQKACRQLPGLNVRLRDELQLGDIASARVLPPSPDTGLLIQAFNRMVEDHWELW